ncbi:MAG TPA: diguanylate cyclase [Caldisericia bacterium]|nr:diguanylate cyclase [Caldisericia bacterium]
MRLRYKIFYINIIVIFLVIISILLIIFSLSKNILDDNIRTRVELYKNNFSNLIEIEKNNLIFHVKDYAYWEEMGIKGVINKDENWIRDNLDPWIRKNFNYDLVLLIKDNGEVIVDTPLLNLNYDDFILKKHDIVSGIKIINNLPIIFATSPVFDSNGEKFYNAYLTFGIIINENLINEWKNYLDFDFAIITENSYISTSEEIEKFQFNEIKPTYQYIHNYISTFLPIYDIEGNKIADVHIHKYDDTITKMNKTILSGIIVGGLLTIISAFIINILLISQIIKPLENLDKATKEISNGNYEIKLDYSKNDEIGHLTNSFKKMLDIIKYREKIITNEKQMAIEMSYKDPLINVFNRKYLIEKVEDLIKYEQPFSIVFLDLDNFKIINDVLGHKVGDELLKKIADWFSNNLRKDDIIARYGGDEFCLILYGLDKKSAYEVIQRLYKLFQLQSFYPEDIPIGFSYGIATFPEDSENIDKLLSIADNKMYQMKEIKFNK